MKRAQDCPATADDIFNLGVRLMATWLVLQHPGMSLDAALYKASEIYTDVAKRHGHLLATLPRADREDELFAVLPPATPKVH
jgi:hypothetical protein